MKALIWVVRIITLLSIIFLAAMFLMDKQRFDMVVQNRYVWRVFLYLCGFVYDFKMMKVYKNIKLFFLDLLPVLLICGLSVFIKEIYFVELLILPLFGFAVSTLLLKLSRRKELSEEASSGMN